MKSMTCKQLGGACDIVFEANTFDELAEKSKQHGMEMFQKQDPDHLEAMLKMQELMQTPKKMQSWIDEKQKEFESLANT